MKTLSVTESSYRQHLENRKRLTPLPRLPMPARDNETFIWVTLAAACASALSFLFL